MATENEYTKRLEEIAKSSLGALSDDEVLALLAERKKITELVHEATLAEEEKRKTEEKELRETIAHELARLNALISPDKPDDELIHLVEERRGWEEKLADLENPQSAQKKVASVSQTSIDKPSQERVTLSPHEAPELPPEEHAAVPLSAGVDHGFGRESIVGNSLEENSDFARIVENIKRNTSSIGKILEELSLATRRNKDFMLAVAQIDAAYAMHYADVSLKKDEDFNLKVIALKNERRSGSVLAEMLPEARTSKVVMAAVKQDYRNVRFALPQMEEYDAILERAKIGALDKIKDLKEGVDISFLVPKILQKDQEFMKKVAEIVPEAQNDL